VGLAQLEGDVKQSSPGMRVTAEVHCPQATPATSLQGLLAATHRGPNPKLKHLASRFDPFDPFHMSIHLQPYELFLEPQAPRMYCIVLSYSTVLYSTGFLRPLCSTQDIFSTSSGICTTKLRWVVWGLRDYLTVSQYPKRLAVHQADPVPNRVIEAESIPIPINSRLAMTMSIRYLFQGDTSQSPWIASWGANNPYTAEHA
jgi:hypothetical protein